MRHYATAAMGADETPAQPQGDGSVVNAVQAGADSAMKSAQDAAKKVADALHAAHEAQAQQAKTEAEEAETRYQAVHTSEAKSAADVAEQAEARKSVDAQQQDLSQKQNDLMDQMLVMVGGASGYTPLLITVW